MTDCVCGAWSCIVVGELPLCLSCAYRLRQIEMPRLVDEQSLTTERRVSQERRHVAPGLEQASSPGNSDITREIEESPTRYHTQYATWPELVAAELAAPSERIDARRRID